MTTGTPMSKWKQREAVVVVATLKRWYMFDESTVVGIIYNSTNNKEYLEGEEWTFKNMTIAHFPKSDLYGEGHLIATSPTGVSFRLNGSEHL